MSRRMIPNSRSRSASCLASLLPAHAGLSEGSVTTEANSTARAVGSGNRAHQWWMPFGCGPIPGILS